MLYLSQCFVTPSVCDSSDMTGQRREMSLSDEDVITKVNLFCLDCAILKIKFLNFLDFELKKHSISG